MDPNYKDIGEIEDRVIEEMAELTKEICKARRFGYLNYHPKDPKKTPNILRIVSELGDAAAVLKEYTEAIEDRVPEELMNAQPPRT